MQFYKIAAGFYYALFACNIIVIHITFLFQVRERLFIVWIGGGWVFWGICSPFVSSDLWAWQAFLSVAEKTIVPIYTQSQQIIYFRPPRTVFFHPQNRDFSFQSYVQC